MGECGRYLKSAVEVVREAGELLKRHFSETGEVFFKGEVDLVTRSDKASQDLIYSRLSKIYPDHDFLGEEGLTELSGSDFRWVFDPLDGTTNFAHRLPVFSISLALEHRRRLVCGVVFNPISGELFTAERGAGAFLNDRRIAVSTIDDLDKSLLATGFPYDIRKTKTNITNHNRFLVRAQAVRRCGSAALDLCFVACGRFDGFWEEKLNPWDTAAGAVIVEEAGGRVTDFEENPVDIYHPEVVASNGFIHRAMLEVLKLNS
jgi:myo-inositol-1(or 4)-monophosphatase